MREIVKVNLENEMDLLLANKRTMKLAELCGLSLTTQTALATAVSEIARCALSGSKKTNLKLGILTLSPNKKQVSAIVCTTNESIGDAEAIRFAKRLVADVHVIKSSSTHDIQINEDLKFSGLITDTKIESFIEYFKTEPPLSPYDEIRRQNIQLLEFSDKLKGSENQYRQLADTLPLMMFQANTEGKIIYTNQWLKEYLGSSLTMTTPSSWQNFVHPDDYTTIKKDWENIFKLRTAFQSQTRLKNKKSGVFLWHLLSIVPVKNENSNITQWTGFFADIHAQKMIEKTLLDNVELKNAQKKLVDYQKLLEEKISELNISNHELEQFAYIASHDLQEPLRKIITFSSLLAGTVNSLDEDSRMYFSKIISSSKRMIELIKDVLDWSRVTKIKEDISSIDLNVIVGNVETDFEILIQQKKAAIQISPLPVVKGIRFQLTQLFANLISNAIKFCDKIPVIKISSRILDREEIKLNNRLDQSLGYTEISVSDNGIGFEQEFGEQIFRIFQRLHDRSEYAGTGIGLSICKKIVENHGGIISAEGVPGKGSRFIIIFPEMVIEKKTVVEPVIPGTSA